MAKNRNAWLGYLAVVVLIVGSVLGGTWFTYATAIGLIYLIFRTL